MSYSKSLSLPGGSLVVSESGGAISVAIQESQSVGGGAAAGVLSVQGSGSVSLSGKQGFDLMMALIEAHSSAAIVPIEKEAQALADAGIASL